MRLLLALIGTVLGFLLGLQLHPLMALALALVGFYLGGRFGSSVTREATRPDTPAEEYAAEPRDSHRVGAYRGLYVDLEIVGESFRQVAIKKVWRQGGADRTFEAELVPESNNPHDRNAVRVEIDGVHVAYLSRESAEEYRAHMGTDQCHIPVHLVQGGREGTIGVFTGRSAADKRRIAP